jgi:hypothetical protein
VAALAKSETARAELHGCAIARAPELVWEHQAARLVAAYDKLARADGSEPG